MPTLAEAIDDLKSLIATNEGKLTEMDFRAADPADQREYERLMDQVADQRRRLAELEQERRWPSV